MTLLLSTKVVADDVAEDKIKTVNPLVHLVIENEGSRPFASVEVESESEQIIEVSNASRRAQKARVNLIGPNQIGRIAPQVIAPGKSALFVARLKPSEKKKIPLTIEVTHQVKIKELVMISVDPKLTVMLRPALLIALCLALLAALPATSQAAPRCFGAASMVGCKNKDLRMRVTPSIEYARQSEWGVGYLRNLDYCRGKKIVIIDGLNACLLGVSARAAKKTFALIGDSHSAHWRPGFAAAAKKRKWQIISLTEGGCEYNLISQLRFGLADKVACAKWRQEIPLFLAKHPEIKTAFFAQVGYQSDYQTEVPSFQAAWAKLPATIEEAVVIRDNPRPRDNLYNCIEAAQQKSRQPGLACSTLRSQNLITDYAIIAAREMKSRRMRALDLSNYFCSAKRCYPVIGGALVYAQGAHQAPQFNETMAPYLLKAIDASGPELP